MFERNTGSWHPRGRELSHGTEARVSGSGKILIYKIDVWQILISTLMPQSHMDICNDSVSSSENSQLIKTKLNDFFFLFISGLEGSCREQFCSQLSPLNPQYVCSCKWPSRWSDAMRTFGKSSCCAQCLLVAADKVKVNHIQ